MTIEDGVGAGVDKDLVRDLARKLLRETAPGELPLLTPASEHFFADPDAALRTRRPEKEVLGFGGEAVVALLTPVVLTVATDVLTHFATQIATKAGARGIASVKAALRELFGLASDGGPHPSSAAFVVTAEQLVAVRSNAFDRAVALDVPKDKAALLADAVVGSLTSHAT